MSENTYIERFFHWFVNRFEAEAYRKMGVEDIKEWAGGDPSKDLVMVINRHRNVIEIESNYFKSARAEFSLVEIGIRFERHLQGI